MSLEFIRPEERYLDEYLAACRESIEHNVREWQPLAPEEFDGWKERALRVYAMLETGEGLPDGVPRMLTYWCVEAGQFIGEVQIRPYLTEAEAKQIGHVGYAVRYSMWHKGWGARLLRFAVEELRRIRVSPVYIACHVDNEGSNRVSRKVGFQYVETRGEGSNAENVYTLK